MFDGGVVRSCSAAGGDGEGSSGRATRLRIEQAAPAKPWVAAEAAIEGDQLRALLERKRREVAVGNAVAAQAQMAAEVAEPRPVRAPRAQHLSGRVQQDVQVPEKSVVSGRTNTRAFVGSRMTLASAASLSPIATSPARACSRKVRASRWWT